MTRLIAAAVTVLLALPVPTLAAEEPRQYAGRAVADVLRELQPDLRIIFSSDLVPTSLRVKEEPKGRDPRQIALQILSPHGLTLQQGPRGTLLVRDVGPLSAWRRARRVSHAYSRTASGLVGRRADGGCRRRAAGSIGLASSCVAAPVDRGVRLRQCAGRAAVADCVGALLGRILPGVCRACHARAWSETGGVRLLARAVWHHTAISPDPGMARRKDRTRVVAHNLGWAPVVRHTRVLARAATPVSPC
jgi:hypothetical protein